MKEYATHFGRPEGRHKAEIPDELTPEAAGIIQDHQKWCRWCNLDPATTTIEKLTQVMEEMGVISTPSPSPVLATSH